MKDGTFSPLFINKKSRMNKDIWYDAESHETKGFMLRKGFHCTTKPIAPHLSEKDRVWILVEVDNYETYKRPESQGGIWILAQKMRIIREL